MMKNEAEPFQKRSGKLRLPFSRYSFYGYLLVCWFMPALVLTFYGVQIGANQSIYYLSVGMSLISATAGWFFLQAWEKKMPRSVARLVKQKVERLQLHPHQDNEIYRMQAEIVELRRGYEHQIDLLQASLAKSKDEVNQIQLEMNQKLDQMRIAYLEFEDLRQEFHRLEAEYSRASESYKEELKHKDLLIAEYQKTVSEQRMILERKQHYIADLDKKVKGLTDEIRGLLQLEKSTPSPQMDLFDRYFSHSNNDRSQLQRYVETAEQLTGADHLGYMGGQSPRFLDMSVDSFAVDQRRLFECFRDETSGILFIYSHVNQGFSFVNRYVKRVLGWSPEKFIHDFPRLVLKGFPEWRMALSKIHTSKESRIPLVIQDKKGEHHRLDCAMKIITRGPFTNDIIGLLTEKPMRPSSN